MKRIIISAMCAFVIAAMMPMCASAMDRQYMAPSGDSIKGHDSNIWDEYSLEPSFNLAVDGTYEIPSYSNAWNYSSYEIKTVSGTSGKVVNIKGNVITGIGTGKVKIYFYGSDGSILKDRTMDKDYITVNVREIKASSTSKTVYISEDGTKDVSFNLNQDITSNSSQIKNTSGNGSNQPVFKIDFANDKLYMQVKKAGTTTSKVNVEGKMVTFKITAKTVKLTTSNMIAYPGKEGDKVSFQSSIPSGVKYSTSDAGVAKVGSNGKLTYKGLGRCYVYAKLDGTTIGKCLIEVTYKTQYKAVKNAYSDMGKKLVYSQAKRMSSNYIDCSSFTSRCYYDKSKGRTLYTIGPTSARDWSLTAAGQAKWLYDRGKAVAYSKVSASKLLPGDLVFYRTEYKGLNPEWKHIDHVGMYVGNGMVMDTVTGRGIGAGSGALDLRYYNEDDRVVFIGRPLK